jgi:hypothetical protein
MSIEAYNAQVKDHIDRFPGNRLIFNITKCCGYSEFLFAYMNSTLADLYRSIQLQFEITDLRLFTVNSASGVKMEIPNDSTVNVRQFILGNPQYFQPQYPMPAKVVYKLYYNSSCHCEAHGHEVSQCIFNTSCNFNANVNVNTDVNVNVNTDANVNANVNTDVNANVNG